MRYRSTTYGTGMGFRKIAKIISPIFIGVGVLLLIGAVVANVVIGNKWEARTEQATGTVVDVRVSRDTDNEGHVRETYCPIVEYTVDGSTHTVDASVCTGSRPQVGEERTVRYNPDDPGDAGIESGTERWFLVILLAGMGGLFTLVAGGIFLIARRMPPTPPTFTGGPAGFQRPQLPPARPGTVGYDTGAVDVLLARIEQAYGARAAGQPPPLSGHELATIQLAPAMGTGSGYDRQTVDQYLAAVRYDLERPR